MSKIYSDKEFRIEAKIFWEKEGRYMPVNNCFNIEAIALEYVRNSGKFKYKDRVEAGVIVDMLTEFGYIKFVKVENCIRYYTITPVGLNIIMKKPYEIVKSNKILAR